MTNDYHKEQEKIERFLKYALILSLLFHLLLILFVKTPLHEVTLKQAEEKIRIVLTPRTEVVPAPQKQREAAKPKQIVATEEGKKEKPKDTRFLGKTDQTFDRQTVAKKNGSFKEAGKGIRKGIEQKQIAKQQTQSNKRQKKEVSKRQSRSNREATKKISFNDLAVGMKKVNHKSLSKTQMANLGIKNGADGKSGLAQNNDFVDDVPLGDMTNLNTVEYKYYGFNYRIRQKLEQYWGRELQHQAELMWRQGRRIPGNQQRLTSLVVYLDPKGNIVDIEIKGTSGVQELDQAAIDSFNQAGPFPNPPQGLLDEGNGLAKVEWGFVVRS